MDVGEGVEFIWALMRELGSILSQVDVLICPPYTAIWPLAQVIDQTSLLLGAQDASLHEDPAHTGEVSPRMLYEIGCFYVMLGHWEVRRHLHEEDPQVNLKILNACRTGLRPVIFTGESCTESSPQVSLPAHLAILLQGLNPEQVSQAVFVYEPEGSIGQAQPVSPQHAGEGCSLIRVWLQQNFGNEAAETARIIYGGSVTSEFSTQLLAYPDIDGLGASRRGRSVADFSAIVRQIHRARSFSGP